MTFERASSLSKLGLRLGIDADARTSFATTHAGIEIWDLDAGKVYTFQGGTFWPEVQPFDVPDDVKRIVTLSNQALLDHWALREQLNPEVKDTIHSELAYRRLSY